MPAKKTEFVALRVTPQEQVRLKTAALVRDISISTLVRQALDEWLAVHGILEPGERVP